MPVNAGPEYGVAELAFHNAKTNEERLKALQSMLTLSPKHKSSEKLVSHLKGKIARLRAAMEKDRISKKGSGLQLMVKRDGAAQVCIIGTTNSGKSTLLHKLTGAQVLIADYPFTTKRPQVGILDYEGVKVQLIEVPAITKNYDKTDLGPTMMAIIRHCDLIILMFNTPKDKKILDKELADIKKPILIFNNQKNLNEEIWKRLPIVKVFTKQPGKPHEKRALDLKKGSTVRGMASRVHKDFIKNFKYAKIWGKSAKFPGQKQGLNHVLVDNDIVEFHTK